MLLHLVEQTLAGRNVAAADEEGGSLEILGPARENGSMNHGANLIGLHAAEAEHIVGPGIDRDHAIEDAWLQVTVKLDEDLSLIHFFCP